MDRFVSPFQGYGNEWKPDPGGTQRLLPLSAALG